MFYENKRVHGAKRKGQLSCHPLTLLPNKCYGYKIHVTTAARSVKNLNDCPLFFNKYSTGVTKIRREQSATNGVILSMPRHKYFSDAKLRKLT